MKQDDWQVVGRDVQGLDRKECQHLIFFPQDRMVCKIYNLKKNSAFCSIIAQYSSSPSTHHNM